MTVFVLGTQTAAFAQSRLEVGEPIELTDQLPDLGNWTAKIKIVRLGSSWLVAAYGDAGSEAIVYDVKARAERQARDIYVTRCNHKRTDCSDLMNWSDPINISNTAALTSASTAWRGPDEGVLPFYGDSEKPNVFNNGSAVVITWVDKYCDSEKQGSVTYLELGERELPYSCLYTSRSLDNGATWSTPQRLSSGLRDAKQDFNRGNDKAWVMTWQEDPLGLQLGQAEGPGDGGSGAKVSKGTDVWYSYLPRADFNAGVEFPEPIRITNNFTKMDSGSDPNPNAESGKEGASRPNLALIGSTVLVAYEETKGTEGLDVGKYIRFHSFRFDAPPSSCAPDDAGAGGDGGGSGTGGVGGADEIECRLSPNGEPYPDPTDPARVGCILSEPQENARRVRFFGQGTPGKNSGVKLFVFWKQGEFDQGGPSDIIGRSATGFTPADFTPPVNVPTAVNPGDELDGCYIRGVELPVATGAFVNERGINLSAGTENGGDLDAATGDNELEDARAHRGFITGDFLVLGYTYTPDWSVARFTDLENYEFWIRRSADGGATWSEPVDLTSESTMMLASALGLPQKGVNVREPRIVKTPGNGPGCPSGDLEAEDTTNPRECRDPSTFVVAWGTETNVYEHLGGAVDLDIFITRSVDKGASYEPYQVLASAGTTADQLEEGESQLRPTPDGKTVFSVWTERSEVDGANGMFAISVATDIPTGGVGGEGGAGGEGGEGGEGGVPGTGGAPGTGGVAGTGGTEPPADEGGTTSGCGSCTVGGPSSGGDMLLMLGVFAILLWRRRQRVGRAA